MRRVYLVYNPAAGRYPSRLLTERAAALLGKLGWEIKIEQTQSGEHITQLARQAAAMEMEAFFVVGGDGSLNYAVSGLIDTPTALGVLPGGTANVWAQELGLPGLTWTRWMALEESALRLADAPVRAVDIGMCDDRPFLLWAGVGLDAFIVQRLEPRSRWEKHFAIVQYAASAVWNASTWRGLNLRVEADGRMVSGHFLLALVSNIHLYAGGYARLTETARLDDGVMDLWLCTGETLGDSVQLVWDLLSGHHVQSDQVEQIPFRSLRLEADSPTFIQIDGEPAGPRQGVKIEVRSHALNVLIPAETPHPLFGSSPVS